MMRDRKSTRLNSSHVAISYAVFCLKKKKTSLEDVKSWSKKFLEIQRWNSIDVDSGDTLWRMRSNFWPQTVDPSPYFSPLFFNDTATTEIYPLSLHDALPILADKTSLDASVAGAGPTRLLGLFG